MSGCPPRPIRWRACQTQLFARRGDSCFEHANDFEHQPGQLRMVGPPRVLGSRDGQWRWLCRSRRPARRCVASDEPTAGKIVDEGSVEFARPELGSHHKKRVAAWVNPLSNATEPNVCSSSCLLMNSLPLMTSGFRPECRAVRLRFENC
jgi:hypothetical protein